MTLAAPALGSPLDLWATLPAGELGRWAGPGWQDDDVDRRLVEGGLRAVADTPEGIVVEPLLSWRLPAMHPGYQQRSSLGSAYVATCRAAAMLGFRRDIEGAVVQLRRAQEALDAAERLLGCGDPAEAGDLRDACAALAGRVRAHGATPEVLKATTGWFGTDTVALLPRTVGRLAAARSHLPASGAGVVDRAEVEAVLAGRAVLGSFTEPALASALAGAGELLATVRLARRERWPGLALIDDRYARHPLRVDVGTTLHALRRLDPDALAGCTRPGRLADPVRLPDPDTDRTVVDAVLMWTGVGRRLLVPGSLPATASMADLVVVDAVREIVGVGLDLLDGAPVRAALGDPSELPVRPAG